MATELTKTQVDRLGDRLRKGAITEADLRLLDHYRRSFSEAYDAVVEAIKNDLGLEPTGRPAKSTTSISDKLRREKPSHGYRAVHVIVNSRGRLIEIQVRTALQHLWAELSEKWSDVFDPAIKYGGGRKNSQEALMLTSTMIAEAEALDIRSADTPPEFQERLRALKQKIFKSVRYTIGQLEKIKGEGDDISD